jgi:hypothetical protein
VRALRALDAGDYQLRPPRNCLREARYESSLTPLLDFLAKSYKIAGHIPRRPIQLGLAASYLALKTGEQNEGRSQSY